MKTRTQLSVFFAGILLAVGANAQTYPAKPIRMIVPYEAASATDVMIRIVAQKMSENLAQQIVVESLPGAAGQIGFVRLMRAAADGYTIGGLANSTLTYVPNLYEKVEFDPIKSFEPVSMVATIDWVLIVHPSMPVTNVREFIALAKAKPGQLDYASSGTGGSHHMGMELFKAATGTSLTHVPYRGATAALLDVLGGRIPGMFTSLVSVVQHIKDGKVRVLAIANATRSTLLPSVPTISEAGVPGFVFETWTGIYTPQGTPKPIIERLNAETIKATADPSVRERLLGMGLVPGGSTPEQLGARTRADLATMTKLIKGLGIKAD